MRRALTTTSSRLSPPHSSSTRLSIRNYVSSQSPARTRTRPPPETVTSAAAPTVSPSRLLGRTASFVATSTQFRMAPSSTSPSAASRSASSPSSFDAVAPPRARGGVLSQAEMDSLVDGITFDDDLSFELGTTSSLRTARTPSPSLSPRDPVAFGPNFAPSPPIGATHPRKSPLPSPAPNTTPTKRKSFIIDSITLSPSTPPAQSRAYASSARIRDEDDEPLPAPPPEDDTFLDQMSALIEREASRAPTEEIIELSDDSSDLSPLPSPVRRNKENIKPKPKPEVELTTRTFARAPTSASSSRWLADLAASQMSSTALRTKAAVPPLIANAKRAVRTTASEPRLATGRASTKLGKAAKDREKQAQLALINPQFKYELYPQKPRMVCSVDEAEIARELGHMKGPLGFDLEWEPYVYTTGQPGPTALAQVCDEKTILLIHCARMAVFSPSLRALVEDPGRIKLGVQIAGDSQKLIRDGFVSNPQGMLELNHVAKAVDATHKATNSWGLVGLQALVAKYLNRYLLKTGSVRCGKWGAKLGEDQMKYAANDVYSSLLVHLRLKALAPEGIDVESLALGFGTYRPAQPNGAPVAKPKPKSAAPPGATPRQLEAYKLLCEDRLSLADATKQMSLTRQIKPLSVVWNFLGALDHSKPPLKYDPAMVLATIARVKGGSKQVMLDEFESLLVKVNQEAAA